MAKVAINGLGRTPISDAARRVDFQQAVDRSRSEF